MSSKSIAFQLQHPIKREFFDFPIFLEISDPDLRLIQWGGQVPDGFGKTLNFTLAGGHAILKHTLIEYDGCKGELSAWINLPAIVTNQEITLNLNHNTPESCENEHLVKQDSAIIYEFYRSSGRDHILDSAIKANLNFEDQMTVEAWIQCEQKHVEMVQPLVSVWHPLENLGPIAGYDASETGGLDCRGYFGAVFDGRFVYFSPQHYENREEHGVVLRLDTQGDFGDPASYAAYDADGTDDLHTCGFYGAAFDGRFVYFVPRQDFKGYHSRVLRYDTTQNFNQSESWEAYDAGFSFSKQGIVYDGRYLYFCPGFSGDVAAEEKLCAEVLRYDTTGDFKNSNSWEVFDASGTSGLDVGCFDGGGFDGRSIYFAPLMNGIILKYDSNMPFQDPNAWCAYDAGTNHQMGMCVGVVYDGVFVYYVPYGHGTVVRYDTRGEFQSPEDWQTFDVVKNSVHPLAGFDGGFFDGRYVYFVPFIHMKPDGELNFHSQFIRYDTKYPFADASSWKIKDCSTVDGIRTIGYNAGAYDGRYLYMAPWRDGSAGGGIHGRVLRLDTLGDQAAFSLRAGDYGHNGGLCGALIGPGFWVNSTSGHCYNAAIPQPLEEGRHYLVGAFDGSYIRLYIDGFLVSFQKASGRIMPSSIPLEIGKMAEGASIFPGTIYAVRISNVSRDEEWISAAYHQFLKWAA